MSDPKEVKRFLERMAEWARSHPGTMGPPDILKDGGPGDSNCQAVFIASCLYAAGQRCRFVAVGEPKDGQESAMYVEVFEEAMPSATKIMDFPPDVRGGFHPELPNFQWVAVLPFHGWIHEGSEILTWKRIAEVEL